MQERVPSNVDVTKLKAEFLQHYYDANGTPLKALLVGNITKLNKIGSLLPAVYNFKISNRFSSWLIKSILGFEQKRQLPLLKKLTLKNWHKKNQKKTAERKVYLFADEFTNFNDSDIGIKSILLLEKLGYEVHIPNISESGRTYLSKGLLKQQRKLLRKCGISLENNW